VKCIIFLALAQIKKIKIDAVFDNYSEKAEKGIKITCIADAL